MRRPFAPRPAPAQTEPCRLRSRFASTAETQRVCSFLPFPVASRPPPALLLSAWETPLMPEALGEAWGRREHWS